MIQHFAGVYDRLVLAQPRLVLVCLGLFFVLFGAGLADFRLDASADSLLLENDPDLKHFRELNQRYHARDFLFVTVTPRGGIFSAEGLKLIARLRTALKAVPAVESVVTVLDVPLVKNVPGKLSEAATHYRTLESSEVNFERARQELTESPLYRNVVMSPDASTTAIRVVLKDHADFRTLQNERGDLLFKRGTTALTEAESARLATIEPVYQRAKDGVDIANHQTLETLRALIAQFSSQAEIHLGGISMIADDMISYVRSDIIVFGIGALALTLGVLGYIFREARWVVTPVITCAVSTVIILGLLGYIGWHLTVISSNFIAINLILTISINIHLIVHYRELLEEHPTWSQFELVQGVVHDMAKPCLYTSLTSMIGFASLVTSNIKPIIDFGWMMTVSLLVVYGVVFTLVPAMMVLMEKRGGRTSDAGKFGFTDFCAQLTDRHGNLVIALTVGVTILGGIGITRLQVENSFISYFKQHTEIYQGLKKVDETLGGTTPLEIILKFPPPEVSKTVAADAQSDEIDALYSDEKPVEKSSYWFTPEKVARIKEVHDYIEKIPGVGKVLSLASLVRVAEDLNKGREFDPFELNVIYKRLPDQLKREMLSPYISIERDEARISLRILDSLPKLRRQALIQQINIGLAHDLGLKQSEYEVVGLLVLYNNMLQSLYSSQIQSVAYSILGVALTLGFLFRNLRAAIIGVIPNFVAAVSVLGIMGWLGIPLDMMTIMIASLTMGIAVEDCIHYLYRYRLEYAQYRDGLKTMYHCHSSIGKAGFYTTVVVCFGFSILVLSNFIPSILFGFLTTLAMTIAIFAALTLMPKMLLMWRPFH
ncbi:MAG: RND family transporter [Gammaproteobacteria bacterium]|nr:RND family transporter [Gammaproteobacteria bacterium]